MTPEDRDLAAIAAGIAGCMWADFTTNEKTLVRFGMFPADKMEPAEAQLRIHAGRDTTRLLAVALMDRAKADGGMCA